MTIATSSIPGVSATRLNQIVYLLATLPGAPSAWRDAVEAFVSAVNSFYAQGSVAVTVSNKTGGTLVKGALVYISAYDSTGLAPEVAKADADAIGKPAMYVLLDDIENGHEGQAASVATISGIDTSTFLEDDILYLATTAGTYTKTAPTGADVVQQAVGVVELVSATQGQIRFDLASSQLQRIYASRVPIVDAGTAITATDVEAALQEVFLLARGNTYYGSAAGKLARADIKALGAILAGDGADAAVVNLLTSALGGTTFAARAYSGGALQEPADDATLTAAIASLMLLRRDAERRLVMDGATPSATAGRGLVVSGSGVTAQAVPDASVIVASGVAYNQLGQRVTCTATPVLAVTTPNPLGGVRNDIVVIPAAGGAPVVREGTVIATDPALTAGDVPLARLRCPNGAVVITGAEIDDLRQTARTLPAAKLLPATTADLLVLLATDQITNAVLLQAIQDGAFMANAATRALFADLFLTDAKLAQDRGKSSGMWVGFTGGSTDITGGAATRELQVNIDGAGLSNVQITAAGLNTGALIAAALQVALRAVGTGGYTLCEVHYDPASLRYVIISGTRGASSSVAVAAGLANDLGISLKLLAADNAVAWAGTESLDRAKAQAAALLATLDTNGLLRALGTDQITNAVLIQAILNGAFQADAATLALFADNLWPVAKMAKGVMLEATGTIPGGNGAGKVGSLNASPVNLIAAPLAGEIIIIDEVEWFLDYASAAYDSVAAGDLLTLVYTGTTAALAAGLSVGFGDQASDQHRVVGPVSPPITTPVAAAGIDAYCAAGDWYAAAGDSPLKYRIRYHVVTMLT